MPVRNLAALAIALAFPAAALAQASQSIDAARSRIRFAFREMNVPVEGGFRRFGATVSFDPARPEATKARFEVDLGSIDLGSPEGETEVRRKTWLDVAAFPTATFIAAAVKATGPGRYVATGALTIKGTSLEVTAPFTVTDAAGMRTVEGRFPIKRLQFRIGEGPWSDTATVADEITVSFRFVIPVDAPRG